MNNDINIDYVHFETEGRTEDIIKLDSLSQALVVKFNLSVVAFENEKHQLVAFGKGFEKNFPYNSVYIPELKELTEYFDRILVFSDGFNFKVFLLQNNLNEKAKTLPTLKKLEEIGKICHKYTGTFGNQKIPVLFQIIELSNEGFNKQSALKSLRRIPGLMKVDVKSISLDFKNKKFWSNGFLNGLFLKRAFYLSTIKSIQEGKEVQIPNAEVEVKIQSEVPALTYTFIVVFTLVFALELWLSKTFSGPDGSTLVSMGAVNHNLVFNFGEHYRLFTAAFLHGSYLHLILNCVALFYIGPVLEMFVGRKWFFTLFGLSVLGGSLASILLGSENVISVGASGGIMGLIAALFIVSFRLPGGAEKTGIQMNALYMLVPALLPIFTTIGGAQIDYAAHFGGAFFGAVVAFFIYKSWLNQKEPGFKKASLILAGILAVMIGGAIVISAFKFSGIQKELAVESKYLPPDLYTKYEKAPEQYQEELEEWAKQWPEDPIIPYFQAMQAVKANDLPGGEAKLKQSLSLIEAQEDGDKYGRGEYIGRVVRMTLAALYLDTGRIQEAKKMAIPLCNKGIEIPDPLKALCQ